MTTENQPARMGDVLRMRHIGGGLLALYRGDELAREIGVTPGWDFRDRDEVIARFNGDDRARELSAHGGDGGGWTRARLADVLGELVVFQNGRYEIGIQEGCSINDEMDEIIVRLNGDAGGDGGGDRAALNYLMQQFDAEVFVCGKCGHEAATKNCDSAIYLRDYLATQQPASGDLEFPECSGTPNDCPENEGHGCCKVAVADECAAISTGHHMGPYGPHGTIQCEYCGESPTPPNAAHGGSGEGPSIGKIVANNYTKYWHDEPPTSASDSEALEDAANHPLWSVVEAMEADLRQASEAVGYANQDGSVTWYQDGSFSSKPKPGTELFTRSPARVGGITGTLNGYLPKQRAVEVIMDEELPEWIKEHGALVTLAQQACP